MKPSPIIPTPTGLNHSAQGCEPLATMGSSASGEAPSPQGDAGASPEIKIGDVVTWTHVSSNGDSYRFQTRRGKVIDGTVLTVTVRYRGGRSPVKILRENVRPFGKKTALTEAFEKMGS